MKNKGSKIGTRLLSFLLCLMLVLGGIYIEPPQQVYATNISARLGAAKSTTITATSATNTLASKIDGYLTKNKSVVLHVKGDKTSSKKIVESLQKKIGKVNKQGVIFQHDGGKQSGKYYNYTISSDNAQLYNYSIKFTKKIYKRAVKQSDANLKDNMANLSEAMKVSVLNSSFCFFTFDFYDDDNGTPYYMVYNIKSAGKFRNSSDLTIMKALVKGTAAGACEDYARAEMAVFRQWGIPCYYNSSSKINHAWSVVKAKNSKGKVLWIPFDYGIGPSTGLYGVDYEKLGLNTEKARYKLYLSGIPGAPSKKNWKKSDFN